MYYLICAVVIALFLYWILQTRDDEAAKREGREPASTSKRVMLFFFLLVVLTCVCFFLSNAVSSDIIHGGDGEVELQEVKLQPNYKSSMIKNIHEDVMTGIPRFVATNDS